MKNKNNQKRKDIEGTSLNIFKIKETFETTNLINDFYEGIKKMNIKAFTDKHLIEKMHYIALVQDMLDNSPKLDRRLMDYSNIIRKVDELSDIFHGEYLRRERGF